MNKFKKIAALAVVALLQRSFAEGITGAIK